MANKKEIQHEPVIKTRVRITTLNNRSSRIAAIRRALSHAKEMDFLIEEVTDLIVEEGCKKLEKQLGIG